MGRNEKLLLLQLILEDIRGNWGSDLMPRLQYAQRLVYDLDLETHKNIDSAIELAQQGEDGFDGRLFRCDWEYGGYIGGEQVHGLPRTICNRSVAFQKAATKLLTYPNYLFEDWDAYVEQD